MKVEELDYELPESRIAQSPLPRGEAKLLVVADPMRDATFTDLEACLPKGALLVLNNTKVLHARLIGRKVLSGGKVELFATRVITPGHLQALTRTSKRLAAGAEIEIEGENKALRVRIGSVERGVAEVFYDPNIDILGLFGKVPLPPYIRREPIAADRTRYQTVFAEAEGAIAAPTAGLHFSEEHLAKLRASHPIAEVTLHVGLGTFRPVEVPDLDDHVMHSEDLEVSAQAIQAIHAAKGEGRSVVAVGTTVVRALESAALGVSLLPLRGATNLLIQPGFEFRVVDHLVTNFHAPRSTLLALVKAFAGSSVIDAAYAHAMKNEYRFLSYGDAMFLSKAEFLTKTTV
ncbi:MAG: tRNA preQ1(34) S-adenosylmethionine ribosyltransferase-isomerase QueA [Polyangiaceae bacterium]|nr:tRNA preQ1(34) S-adenosylmethionine ribosyltransferase-isomerase QueA [Polyangiaceae bacterium]